MPWIALLMLGLMGCSGGFYERRMAELDAEEAEERANEQRANPDADKPDLDQLTARGRFDLQCADATAVVLERHDTGPLTLVGVQGCGRQIQYSHRLRRDVKWGGMTTRNTQWGPVVGSQVAIASGS